MSFTTQIVPIGQGISATPQTEIDPIYISSDLPMGSIGSEGSTDDPQELFPDTFVDLAKESEESIEKDPPKKKKRSFFSRKRAVTQDFEDSTESEEEMKEEVL